VGWQPSRSYRSIPLRQILASLALAAAAVLDVTVAVQPDPAQAQVRLPALGEAEGDELSISDERKVGDQIMREIYADPDVIDDPVEYAYVDSVFERLLAASDRRGNISPEMKESFAWAPFLVKDRSFNAFALPGGYIGVHLGLISSSGTRPITTAGLPATMLRSGTSRVTTEPAPTKAFSPIVTAGQITLPPPIRAARRMRGAARKNWSEGRR